MELVSIKSKNGLSIKDAILLAKELKKIGFDYISVSSGGILPLTKMQQYEGFRVKMAKKIKNASKIITTTSGMITDHNISNNHRIGLDIKTTYVRNSMLFTLGGYNSFLRNNTKNILYPYNTYSEHWILAFIYEQLPPFAEYDLKNFPARGEVPCPYKVKAVFIRHKHEITGLRAGSGNTKNIGSVKLNSPNDFSEVQGPFCFFENPKEACDHYWKSYESYKDVVFNKEDLLMHPEFKRFGPTFS